MPQSFHKGATYDDDPKAEAETSGRPGGAPLSQFVESAGKLCMSPGGGGGGRWKLKAQFAWSRSNSQEPPNSILGWHFSSLAAAI